MNNLTELLNSCNYKDLDKNEAYEHGEAQKEFITTLYSKFPHVVLEENWVAIFFEYLKKLFDPVYERNGFSVATSQKTIYMCSPHTTIYKSLRRLLWDCMLNTPNKLTAIQQFRIENKKFQHNTPQSLAVGWLLNLYFDNYHSNLTQKWNLNEEEEREVFLMMQDLLDQMQDILLHQQCEFKDFDALLDASSDFRKTIRTHSKLQPTNDRLVEMLHQLNLIELLGFHDFGINVFDSFEDFYEANTHPFSQETLFSATSKEQLLSSAIHYFTKDKKTGYILLLTRYFLVAFEAIVEDIDNFKESVRVGSSLGNTFGFSPLETAIECLAICTEESNSISTYLSNHIQDQNAKFILKTIINDQYYSLIESAPEDGKLIKELVQKTCNITSSETEDIELKRLLVRWNMVDESTLSSNDKIEIPKALPQSVDELTILIKQLKLESYLKFNAPADAQKLKSYGYIPEAIKEVYAWKNGCEDDFFLPFSEIGGVESEVEWQYDNHMEQEEEAEDYEYTWPNEVDIRNHIDTIVGVGRVGNGDFYFIDANCFSIKNKHVVFRNRHDSLLTAQAVANSLEEFIGRMLIEHCLKIYGPNQQLQDILDEKVLRKEV